MDLKISTNSISTIESISVGGAKQTILIQSENSNHPVMLYMHGGPSMPVPGVSRRGL